jgi:DNA-binding LytR/AlgR family response regulator
MARTAMKQLASRVDDITVAGECSNAMEAYNLMQSSQQVDILFLDIEMPEMTGLELTRRLGDKKPIIVFTTSKKEYAVDAFELNVADYIIKPVTPSRLQAVEKVREIYNSIKVDISVEEKEFVFIRDNGILKRLLIDDIHFLEAMGDYVKVFTLLKFHAIHSTLKNVEDKLPSNKFLRVHRSYIVALNKIEKIEEGVIVINSKAIPVADAYRSTLNKRLNIL